MERGGERARARSNRSSHKRKKDLFGTWPPQQEQWRYVFEGVSGSWSTPWQERGQYETHTRNRSRPSCRRGEDPRRLRNGVQRRRTERSVEREERKPTTRTRRIAADTPARRGAGNSSDGGATDLRKLAGADHEAGSQQEWSGAKNAQARTRDHDARTG